MNHPFSPVTQPGFRRYAASTVFLPLLILLLSGCNTDKIHLWSDLPKDRVAVIMPDRDKAFTEVYIVSVDGEEVGFFDSAVEVTPGRHTVFVVVLMDCPYINRNHYLLQHLSFETKKGCLYTVHGRIDTLYNEGYVWVTTNTPPDQFVVGFKHIPL